MKTILNNETAMIVSHNTNEASPLLVLKGRENRSLRDSGFSGRFSSMPLSEGARIKSTCLDNRILVSLKYLEEHFRERALDLKTLSKVAGLSCWHFSRLFKAQVGKGCRHYLRDLRLRHAEKLLCNTVLSIKEISAQIGYAYTSDFTHHFKKQYGVSPRIFRNSRNEYFDSVTVAITPNKKQELPTKTSGTYGRC
jgi:AraC-like DNA-binding protein